MLSGENRLEVFKIVNGEDVGIITSKCNVKGAFCGKAQIVI